MYSPPNRRISWSITLPVSTRKARVYLLSILFLCVSTAPSNGGIIMIQLLSVFPITIHVNKVLTIISMLSIYMMLKPSLTQPHKVLYFNLTQPVVSKIHGKLAHF